MGGVRGGEERDTHTHTQEHTHTGTYTRVFHLPFSDLPFKKVPEKWPENAKSYCEACWGVFVDCRRLGWLNIWRGRCSSPILGVCRGFLFCIGLRGGQDWGTKVSSLAGEAFADGRGIEIELKSYFGNDNVLSLRPIRCQAAWEYHEPGPPNEPGPLALSHEIILWQ